MIHSQPALGLAADSNFFDWPTNADSRFFLAPEVMPFNGYRVHAPQLEHAEIEQAPTYAEELPRSAS